MEHANVHYVDIQAMAIKLLVCECKLNASYFVVVFALKRTLPCYGQPSTEQTTVFTSVILNKIFTLHCFF